jgi:hypothetical protein
MTIPLTVEKTLAHADRLAARLRNCEPNPAAEFDEQGIALLRVAIAERSQSESKLLGAVTQARSGLMRGGSRPATPATIGTMAKPVAGSSV